MSISSQQSGSRWTRVPSIAAVVAIIAFGWYAAADSLTSDRLASYEEELRAWKQSDPLLAYGAAFVGYVAITGLSLPGAAVLTLVYGWYFGLMHGVVLVSFASTSGATLAFLLSRFLLRDIVQAAFGERLHAFRDHLDREGAFYLFTLRLIPVVPFFVVNMVMGLTSIRVRTFWWVSQLGMLAGTIVYVYAGASVPTLEAFSSTGVGGVLSMRSAAAFAALGLFPWLTKKSLAWLERRRARSGRGQNASVQHTSSRHVAGSSVEPA